MVLSVLLVVPSIPQEQLLIIGKCAAKVETAARAAR